ncbi:hypothetical protein ACIA48_29190 [Mycobacterium sp. NPDC051804]|uniref:hypothetical protein n=1 Tax=Mycobacterium sp. NPDC051804 TaxID=3364295 RepID=UPI00379BE134
MKNIGASMAFVGVMGFTAVGLSTAVANAEPAVPNSAGVPFKLDKPRWHDRRDDYREWRDDYRYYGPCAWVPPNVSGWVPPAVC